MYERNHRIRTIAVIGLLGVVALAAGSCSKNQASTQTSDTTSTAMAPETTQTPMTPAISDANIAAIVVAADQADIDNGKQAETKSRNAEVKAFAKQMVTDHGSVNEKAKALATKLNLTPEDNDTSRGIKAQQDSIRAALKGQSGSAFDKAYADNEVAYHETVLNALDQTLIPNAQNAELKQLLTDVRPTIAAHLEHAKQIQQKLSTSASK